VVRSVADSKKTGRQQERMLPLLKRHEVLVLRGAGFDQSDVARRTGVAVRTVKRIEREGTVLHVDDNAEVKRRRIGRPSKAEPFRPFVVRHLAEQPDIMSLELLRRAKLDGYSGSKTALYALIATLRPPKQQAPVVRFEGVLGEFSQHDFGQVDVTFIDGSTKRVHFFASRLKYSRMVQVTIVPNQQVEPLVRTLATHFDAFGGVPLLAVFDRPKTIAFKWKKDGSVTDWNPTFAQSMLELGVGVELCWPRRGNQKGSVENLVGWVKGSFFKQRRFIDDADLEEQLRAWLVEVNTKTVSRATGVTPEARMVAERERLRPLKVKPAELALRFPVLVGPTGFVLHDGALYSMPPESLGLSGMLFLYASRVHIVAGRFNAWHDRKKPGEKAVSPEHRAQRVAAVSGKRAKRYEKREQLLMLGSSAHDYITVLVHRKPKTWLHDVEKMFELLQDYGDDAMRDAIALALGEQTFGAAYVSHFLKSSASEARRASRRAGGAQPRDCERIQLPLPFGSAERRGGCS